MKTSTGWVYVVTHSNAKGLFKIGITRNPANRKDQLGGDDLTVLAMLLSWNPESTEKHLHQKYKAVRLPQSDWFDLTKDQLKGVIDQLQTQHAQVLRYVVIPEPEVEEPEVDEPTITNQLDKAKLGATAIAGYEWDESRKMFRRPAKESHSEQIPEMVESPAPMPTMEGEPIWDRNYRVWRYINKEGVKCTAGSMQEALNDQ